MSHARATSVEIPQHARPHGLAHAAFKSSGVSVDRSGPDRDSRPDRRPTGLDETAARSDGRLRDARARPSSARRIGPGRGFAQQVKLPPHPLSHKSPRFGLGPGGLPPPGPLLCRGRARSRGTGRRGRPPRVFQTTRVGDRPLARSLALSPSAPRRGKTRRDSERSGGERREEGERSRAERGGATEEQPAGDRAARGGDARRGEEAESGGGGSGRRRSTETLGAAWWARARVSARTTHEDQCDTTKLAIAGENTATVSLAIVAKTFQVRRDARSRPDGPAARLARIPHAGTNFATRTAT